ncbi:MULTISPECIES: carboxylating nicotinate-nucleotide diphosphorylase [Bacillaceae]|uniref:nicotinate-nucleotide diphosphorylase (carboxylating) n=1 Tax=Evansella alkalicola TaxID=745819 RepID=A0ABS6JST4_9BACI|nr:MULTISPECIES: carboxylating nicotinate-nucleotide diphosphorylase [Bacillaceae]MBU9720764.1 carboxylating nicotinate-nucleotide diphosphorylase [Bacillus alkalicola]
MNKLLLREQLMQFMKEDLGFGDRTSEWIFSNEITKAIFLAKSKGVFAGEEVLIEGYKLLQSDIDLTLLKRDGDNLEPGDVIAEVTGPTVDILSSERVLLNLVQRMSGIATLTQEAVTRLGETQTRICDTRKTTPGLRMLEKHAVVSGGGFNHRLRLDDAVMIKDNHIARCGSITAAVTKVREKAGHMIKIEVEAESVADVKEAVEAGADVIMFDNSTVEQAIQWRNEVPPSIITEVSGGITLETLPEFGKTGVDYISIGALTHSAKALDISLDIQINREG